MTSLLGWYINSQFPVKHNEIYVQKVETVFRMKPAWYDLTRYDMTDIYACAQYFVCKQMLTWISDIYLCRSFDGVVGKMVDCPHARRMCVIVWEVSDTVDHVSRFSEPWVISVGNKWSIIIDKYAFFDCLLIIYYGFLDMWTYFRA